MHPVRPTSRSSWVSLFLGLTAAAGIYTAIRELLRRYIVPLYFPDAARIAEERRLREENTFLAQERHIGKITMQSLSNIIPFMFLLSFSNLYLPRDT